MKFLVIPPVLGLKHSQKLVSGETGKPEAPDPTWHCFQVCILLLERGQNTKLGSMWFSSVCYWLLPYLGHITVDALRLLFHRCKTRLPAFFLLPRLKKEIRAGGVILRSPY